MPEQEDVTQGSVTPGTEQPTGAVQPAPAAPTTPSLPPDYEELRQKAAWYDDLNTRLSPHAQRIQKLLEDQEYAGYIDTSYDTYQKLREQQKPQLGPEWDESNNPIIRDIKEVSSYAKELKNREAQAAESKKQAWLNDATQYAGRLQAENPKVAQLLAEDKDLSLVIMNKAFAAGESFEDGIKRFVTRYGIAGQAEPQSPPPSLNPNAGGANMLEETPREKDTRTKRARVRDMSPAERRAYMADLLAREQKKAG